MKKNDKKNSLLTKEYFDKKQKNYVTKDYLDKKLENYITKDYLDKKLENYVTIDYLDKKLDAERKYIDFKLDPINEFMKKFDKFHEKILDKLDWLVAKYTKFEEEYLVASERDDRIDKKLGNHEDRILVLEKKSVYKTS